MKITIGGDLVLSEFYEISKIDKSISNIFQNSDLNILNLEAPITSSNNKISKTGPHIKADLKSTEEVLNLLNVDFLTLANNHIKDYDDQGIKETLEFCESNSISTIGAGMDIKSASEIKYLTTEIGIISVLNFTENEWSIASESSSGANPLDLINNSRDIKKAKENSDFLILIIHGGNEHYKYPSPRMVKQYRYYAELGANLIVGHHTHCLSGYELFGKTPIFYSLGNFLFTMRRKNPESWYTGLILNLEINNSKDVSFSLLPIRQSQQDFSIKLLEEMEKQNVLLEISKINKIIENKSLLEDTWSQFVEKNHSAFVRNISPVGGISNKYLKALFYRSHLYKLFLNDSYVKEFLNRIRCEAHYDLTKDIFNKMLK